MARLLFLNQPTVGHLNTLLTIAMQMKEDGHTVHFLIPGTDKRIPQLNLSALQTARSIPTMIEKKGVTFDLLEIRPSPGLLFSVMRLPLSTGYDEFLAAIDLFTHSLESLSNRIIEFLGSYKPDALVSDFGFPATSIAADAAKIPFINIYHSGLPFRGPGIPPFASGLPIPVPQGKELDVYERKERKVLGRLDARINRVRRALGLAEIEPGLLRRPYSQWLNLVTSVEAIEAPRDNLGSSTLYIGPCFSKRQQSASDFPFDQLRAECYKVYVSLGTVFNNKPDAFRKIMRGLDRPEFQVIVSAGGAYETLVREPHPENVMLFRSVPQVDLLPRVDMVIGHGGNNSTNETLAAGKPLIVVPVGGEQGDNASRVEYLHTGMRLHLDSFTPDEIYKNVMQIRSEPAYRDRLAELQARIAKTDGPSTASKAIQWVAENQKPLVRPEGAPLTVERGALWVK
jgi:MGT family glycosyltransferase